MRAENAALRKRLGLDAPREECAAPEGLQTPVTVVNRHSLSEEKIALFRSLFAGRTDVFARRWYGVTSGKSGYQPVCGNEWDETLCDKKKYKCADCPNRKLLSLTDQDIYAHLEGKDKYARDVVGVYPMLPDESCAFFLCGF